MAQSNLLQDNFGDKSIDLKSCSKTKMKIEEIPLKTKTGADGIWHDTQYLLLQGLSTQSPLPPMMLSEPQLSLVYPFGSPGYHFVNDWLLKTSEVVIEVHLPSSGSSHQPFQIPFTQNLPAFHNLD